jgi:hypothetical protein
MACEGAGGFHTYLDSIDDLGQHIAGEVISRF